MAGEKANGYHNGQRLLQPHGLYPMRDYQREFIGFALRHGVLRFGNFTLKSGRQSPYFFNAGLFDSGGALLALVVAGVGGTGVVTIGYILGMAAHLEGRHVSVLDQTGLAQKGGAVTCHIRIAPAPADIHAVRIAAGEADLVIGCDMVVVNDYWALSKIRAERCTAAAAMETVLAPIAVVE